MDARTQTLEGRPTSPYESFSGRFLRVDLVTYILEKEYMFELQNREPGYTSSVVSTPQSRKMFFMSKPSRFSRMLIIDNTSLMPSRTMSSVLSSDSEAAAVSDFVD